MSTLAYQIKPARCKKSVTLDEAVKQWEPSKDFIYEVKEDGRRYLLQSKPNGAGINYLTSRRISVVTKTYVEKQESVPMVRDHEFPEWPETIFDGEWCGGETSNEAATEMAEGRGYYVYWDILKFNGVDLVEDELWKRRLLLDKLEGQMPIWMRRIKTFADPKAGFIYVKKRNLEGLVRKEVNSVYGEGWTKAKKIETHDVIIWGYEPTKSEDWKRKRWIGALLIGQWQETKRVAFSSRSPFKPVPGQRARWNDKSYIFVDCGRCSGFNNKLREEFSTDQIKYKGSVVEIKCNLRFDTGKFRHPEFLRLRDDKNAAECIWLSGKEQD